MSENVEWCFTRDKISNKRKFSVFLGILSPIFLIFFRDGSNTVIENMKRDAHQSPLESNLHARHHVRKSAQVVVTATAESIKLKMVKKEGEKEVSNQLVLA